MEGSSAFCLLKKGTTLWDGLTGATADYASTLDVNDQMDFDQLSAKLKERFPFQKREVVRIGTLRR